MEVLYKLHLNFFLVLKQTLTAFSKKRANFWVIYFFNLSVNGIKKHHNTLMQNGFLKAANNLTVMLCCKGHLIFKVVLYPLMCIRTYRKQLLRYIVLNKESENCNTWFWCLLFCYLPLPPPPISVAIFSTHGTVTKLQFEKTYQSNNILWMNYMHVLWLLVPAYEK